MNFYTRLTESSRLTFSFLKANKLRSLLSVLGVTIGIFCIVAVWTVTHSLEKNIRSNIDKLGDKIVYVQKWPWGFGGTYKWWEYLNRPEATLKEYERLKKESSNDVVANVAFNFQFRNNKLKSPFEEVSSVKAIAIEGDFFIINQWEILLGREFTQFELERGKNTAILGYNLAVNLFQGANPVGKQMRFQGSPVTVIGVLEKQGNNMGGEQYDNEILIPAKFGLRYAKPNSNNVSSAIIVKGREDIKLDRLDFEITRILRSSRKLRPKDKDTFAINKLTMFSDTLSQTFATINSVALIIGLLSLLVGGFGIANIMFVSVKERTNIIGLQKALGAKRSFVLIQFLIEAVFLCIVGAVIGIIIVYLGGLAVTYFSDFTIHFSLYILTICLLLAMAIGLIAGLAPAIRASKLDPVEALRK